MTAPELELRAAWNQVAGRRHEHLLDQVLTRHRETHRRYHTCTHVMWVLRHIAALAAADTTDTLDRPALQLAGLYHDAVYDPRAADNEALSAELARSAALDLGWDPMRAEVVHRLVMATAGHRPTDPMEAVLVDADLAVLGSPPGDYQAYVAGVRAEYSHVDDDAWRTGRAAVLRSFLELPNLFTTPTMRATREARARANIAAELAQLASAQ